MAFEVCFSFIFYGVVFRCWFFLQRITTASSTVFLESRTAGGTTWSVLAKSRIDELAAKTVLRRAG